jgi:hypothetical protein
MSKYQAAYAHSDNDSVGQMDLDASSDTQAVEEVREFVRTGHRNGTWANVELSDGRVYGCRNEHGEAVGGFA